MAKNKCTHGRTNKVKAILFVSRYMVRKYGWEGAVRKIMNKKPTNAKK